MDDPVPSPPEPTDPDPITIDGPAVVELPAVEIWPTCQNGQVVDNGVCIDRPPIECPGGIVDHLGICTPESSPTCDGQPCEAPPAVTPIVEMPAPAALPATGFEGQFAIGGTLSILLGVALLTLRRFLCLRRFL